MKLIPCSLTEHVRGLFAVLGIIGFPLAILGKFSRIMTEWPGQIIWLIAGSFLPFRPKTGLIVAAALAALGFLGSWCAYAVNDLASPPSPAAHCADVNRFALTFLLGFIFFTAGIFLRAMWKR